MFEGTTCSEQLRGVCLNRKTRKTDTKKLITPPYHVELGIFYRLGPGDMAPETSE